MTPEQAAIYEAEQYTRALRDRATLWVLVTELCEVLESGEKHNLRCPWCNAITLSDPRKHHYEGCSFVEAIAKAKQIKQGIVAANPTSL